MNKVLILLLILISCKTHEKRNTPKLKYTFNVKNYGAKGDFVQDDTKAIQNCFSAIEKNGSGVAYFPNGTYKISRTSIAGKVWCLKGVNNISIKGENKDRTILKLAKKQKKFTRMLVLEGNTNVKIENITFDGNLDNQKNPTDPNEHLSGVFIDHSKDISINNSNFINTGGDGIGIRGVKTPSKNISITNCFFDNNQRNGLTLGSGFDGVIIKDNIFEKHIDDSPIDTEPTSGICQNVLIEDNIINTRSLLTLGGVSYKNFGKNFLVQNNVLNNCSIFIVRGDSIVIKNNKITIDHPRKEAITCIASNKSIYIENNEISIKNKAAFYIVKTQYSKLAPENIHITNNIIKTFGNVNAFDIRGANDIFIEHNQIIGNKGKFGIYCFSNFEMNSIYINNNTIKGFKTGIKIIPSKNNRIKNIKISNNIFSSNIQIMQTAIDYKYHGRNGLNLLENLQIINNKVSSSSLFNKIKQ